MNPSTQAAARGAQTFRYPKLELHGLPASFRELWEPRLSGTALILDLDEALELAAGVELVFAAMRRTLSSYGDRVEGYMASLGIGGRRAEKLARFSAIEPDPYLRADLYLTNAGWQILEMNVASDLGMLDHWQVSDLVAQSTLASSLGWHSISPAHALREAILRRHARQNSAPRCVIAVPPRTPREFDQIVASNADALTRAGLNMEVGELAEFSSVGDELWFRGSRVDVVLRYFHVDDLLDEAVFASAEPILSAMEAETVRVWSNPNSSLLSNKGALALLWDRVDSGELPPDESDAVARLVPRTIFVSPSEPKSEAAAPLRDRPSWVVKPATGSGGVGVVCGWEVDDAQWLAAVKDAARDHGAVLQKRVDSLVFPLGADERESYSVVWGMFLVDGELAGMTTRAQPVTDGAVVAFQGHSGAVVSPVLFSNTSRRDEGDDAAHLFVYGTLMLPEVLRAITDRMPESIPWTVQGWRRVMLRDRTFPGLIPGEHDDRTDGMLLLGLTQSERRLLRDYEGPMYELADLGVGSDGSAVVGYVCVDEHLTRGRPVWQPETFSHEMLAECLDRIRRWRASLRCEESQSTDPRIP